MALGAITRIDISHNALVQLPSELFTLCSLRTLNVAQNRLERLPHGHSTTTASAAASSGSSASNSGNRSASRYDCPMLEELYLQDNRLEEVPPGIFALPALVTLDVSNNKLQSLPYAIWMAAKLRDLNVAFNLLKDLPYCASVSRNAVFRAFNGGLIPTILFRLQKVNSMAGEEGNLFQELNLPHSHHVRRNRLT